MTFYKLYDQHYREFLSSSTLLASLVPPKLREKVLKVEDVWDEIGAEDLKQYQARNGSIFSIPSAIKFLIPSHIAG